MKTALYEKHRGSGARFVDFSGWEMPLYYRGINEEHLAVRTRAGLFDVSHMGRISIEGPDAEAFMDYLSANKIKGKKELSATYTVLCSSGGGCVDDTIIYRIDSERFFMVANAANRQKDLGHLQEYSKNYKVAITPRFENEGILAIQGPASAAIVGAIFPGSRSLTHMHFIETTYLEHRLFLSRTGYTGADGFELYAPNEILESLWDLLMQYGVPHGILPVGLGARNTLRMEMGYALYGHEIDETIAPTESVAAWSVKQDKQDFLGKSALVALEKSHTKRSEFGIVLKDPGVIRDDYLLFKDGEEVGKVTSGCYSPTLKQSIGLILCHKHMQPGYPVKVQIRKQFCDAEVVDLPFILSPKENT